MISLIYLLVGIFVTYKLWEPAGMVLNEGYIGDAMIVTSFVLLWPIAGLYILFRAGDKADIISKGIFTVLYAPFTIPFWICWYLGVIDRSKYNGDI